MILISSTAAAGSFGLREKDPQFASVCLALAGRSFPPPIPEMYKHNQHSGNLLPC